MKRDKNSAPKSRTSEATSQSAPMANFDDTVSELSDKEFGAWYGEFSECDICKKTIKYGNAVVSVRREIAQVDRDEDFVDDIVNVMHTDALLTLCASCARRISTDKLKEHLQLLLRSLCAH